MNLVAVGLSQLTLRDVEGWHFLPHIWAFRGRNQEVFVVRHTDLQYLVIFCRHRRFCLRCIMSLLSPRAMDTEMLQRPDEFATLCDCLFRRRGDFIRSVACFFVHFANSCGFGGISSCILSVSLACFPEGLACWGAKLSLWSVGDERCFFGWGEGSQVAVNLSQCSLCFQRSRNQLKFPAPGAIHSLQPFIDVDLRLCGKPIPMRPTKVDCRRLGYIQCTQNSPGPWVELFFQLVYRGWFKLWRFVT